MKRDEMVEKIAAKGALTKSDADRAIDAFLDTIKGELSEEGEIHISDFGTFKVKHREEHQGRNPQTGESITIPAKNVVKFKPGKSMNELVNS